MNYNHIKQEVVRFNNIAEELNLPKLYGVGGFSRDLVFSDGNLSAVNDVDLTCCAGPKTTILGLLIGKELGGSISYFNNHCSVHINSVKYDFSSGFISDTIEETGDRFIDEMSSRDFTIDAILLDFEKDTLIDITKMGISDIKNGLIRTVISPKESYIADPKRAMRAIELSTRFGFKIEERSIDFFISNFDFFNKFHNENSKNSVSMVAKCLENNESETLSLLRDTKFLYQVPLSGEFKEFIIRNNLVEEYLDNQKIVHTNII
jgi:tRNA nucleotidyltransferase/poly(A) polymerase